MGKEKVVA